MSDKLAQLLARCKCGVYLLVNAHRDVYETAAQTLDDIQASGCAPSMSEELRARILSTDNIVDLQFYPDTPIGSYRIIDADLDLALDRALECLKLKEPHEAR